MVSIQIAESALLGFLNLMEGRGEYVWFINKTSSCHITLILSYLWNLLKISNDIKKGVKS